MRAIPVLYMVIPCYNEESVLSITAPMFLDEISSLIKKGKIDENSRILFVNDGSKDRTWEIISDLSKNNKSFEGISLSRNRGHQNAVLAGLMEAMEGCDITISIDCDGQDDVAAVEEMVDAYMGGSDIVYGVRKERKTDTAFKRFSAKGYYRFLNLMGVEALYNHADYRLVSSKVLKEFANFREVNLYLRGMFPLVGFKSSAVYYTRTKRIAGKSKYPLSKMIELAADGITSLSVKPIRIITGLGFIVAIMSFLAILWSIGERFFGNTVSGWTSLTCIICFLSGVQLLSLGVVGEYIGKIYLEVKNRPRYIVSDRTKN